jgi:hypothetical protein
VTDAADLVAAVREWIEDLRERLAGRDRFLARVSSNALSIVERELRAAPVLSAAERLGWPSDRALASAIRAGALDDRFDEVIEMLRRVTAEALAIDDPRHR